MAELLYSDVVEISPAQSEQRLLDMLDDADFIATSWQEGALVATLVKMTSNVESRLSRIDVFLKKAFQSSTARGEALTRTASGFYNNTREESVAAQHLVTLECSADEGPHIIDLNDLVLGHPEGSTFRNEEGNAVVYPATLTSGGSITLLFQAEIPGSQANIGNALSEDAVTLSLETTLAGVTITSHTLFRAGVDEEGDDRLDQRNRNKWADLEALEFIDDRLKYVCVKASASIVHVAPDSTNPRGAGTCDVYLAGLDATASDDDVAKAQLAIDRRTMGRNATPKAYIVKKSPTVEISFAGIVYYGGTASAEELKGKVDETLLAFIRATPSGGFDFSPGPRGIIRLNDLESVIRLAVTDFTGRTATVELSSPDEDVAIPAFGRPILGSTTSLVFQPITSNQGV